MTGGYDELQRALKRMAEEGIAERLKAAVRGTQEEIKTTQAMRHVQTSTFVPKTPRDHTIEKAVRNIETVIADFHRGAIGREQMATKIKLEAKQL